MGDEPRLWKGHEGDWVTYLQQTLNYRGMKVGAVDSRFGDTTEAVVRQFQTSNNLKVDGIVDTQTWDALVRGATQTGSTAEVADERLARFDINDYPLLAVAAQCEEGPAGLRQFLLAYGMEGTIVEALFAYH